MKILKLTSGLTEVLTPRKFRPRERSEQSWRNFQRWGKIWTEKPARFRSRLSPVKLSEGLNFSATLRSEAEEKFKVIFWAFIQANTVSYQEQQSRRENRF